MKHLLLAPIAFILALLCWWSDRFCEWLDRVTYMKDT